MSIVFEIFLALVIVYCVYLAKAIAENALRNYGTLRKVEIAAKMPGVNADEKIRNFDKYVKKAS